MKIRMISSEMGSIDGARVAPYAAGTEHDLSESAGARDLAAAFVEAGMAEEVHPEAKPAPAPKMAPPHDNKDMGAAPQNKAKHK